MSDDADGNVIEMGSRPKLPPRFSIKDMLNAPPPPPAPAEPVEVAAADDPGKPGDGDVLPQPGDPYQAFGRVGTKPEATLHLLLKDGHYRGFSWSYFDSIDLLSQGGANGGPVVVVRFGGLMPTEVRISGQNLGRMHVYLGQNRLAWLRELPKGKILGDRNAPSITAIELVTLKD